MPAAADAGSEAVRDLRNDALRGVSTRGCMCTYTFLAASCAGRLAPPQRDVEDLLRATVLAGQRALRSVCDAAGQRMARRMLGKTLQPFL